MLQRKRDDGAVLDRLREFCTIHHAALRGGQLALLRVLGAYPRDVVAVDAGNNGTAHYTALRPNLDTYKFLWKALSKCQPSPAKALNASTSTKFKVEGEAEGEDFVEKSGWLSKFTQKGWKKRWFVLQSDGLHYYHSEDTTKNKRERDFFPLNKKSAFYSRSRIYPDSLLINTSLKSTGKSRASIILKASGERDFQEWALAISTLVSFNRFSKASVRFRNPNLCRLWLSDVTWAKETALHTLSRLKNATGGGGNAMSIISVGAWLVEHGCPVNDQNFEFNTALHLACEANNEGLAVYLVRKGANTTSRNANNQTPLMIARPELRRLLESAVSDPRIKLRNPLLAQPKKLPGYSYLSINFERHVSPNNRLVIKNIIVIIVFFLYIFALFFFFTFITLITFFFTYYIFIHIVRSTNTQKQI